MIHTAARRRIELLGAGALFSLFALLACGGTESSAPRAGGSGKQTKTSALSPAEVSKRARTQYDTVCLTCHGSQGRGDGPGAAALNPKPRTFTDPEWQKIATDDGIKKAILLGGAAVGKTANMPAHPLLKDQPLVVDELVKIVRAFGESAPQSTN